MTDWNSIWSESVDPETGEDASPEQDAWVQARGEDGDGTMPYDEADGPQE